MADTNQILDQVLDTSTGTLKVETGAAISNASRLTLEASAAETASGSAAAQSVGQYKEALVTLNCTAASGTTPTLAVVIQASDDGGTTWYNLPGGSFTQLTAAGSQAIQVNTFGDTIRAAWTIGGTTPSFTFAVKAVLK